MATKTYTVLVFALLACVWVRAEQPLACPLQWHSGYATYANLLEDGGSVPAFQGAQACISAADYSLFLLANGHGPYLPLNVGQAAAQQAVETASTVLMAKLGISTPDTNYAKLLADSFGSASRLLQRGEAFAHAGTSLMAVLCLQDRIITSHVGDVRAVVCRGGLPFALSFDHVPSRPDEYDRITSAGEKVDLFDKPRICGLSVSRSIGDASINKYVSAEPEVMVAPLTSNDEFILIAYGIWSVMSNDSAVRLVREELAQGHSAEQAASELLFAAKNGARGAGGRSSESMSALVIRRGATRNAVSQPTPFFSHAADLLMMDNDQWLTGSVALHPVVASIIQAQKYIGQHRSQLQPANALQQAFVDVFVPGGSAHEVLEQYYNYQRFKKDELRAWASNDVAAINSVLASNNFDISLTKVEGQPAFYVASVLDVGVKWRAKGLATKIKVGNVLYDAVCMNKNVLTYTDDLHEHPIFAVLTDNKDIIFMTKADQIRSNISLLGYVTKLQRDMMLSKKSYDELVFPMVDFADTGEVKMLENLKLDDHWYIAQAVQQTKFKMNQHGARARSAGAMSVAVRSVPYHQVHSYTMNEPFFCWLSRPGMRQPIFASYISPNQWKDPGNLADDVREDSVDIPTYKTQNPE